MKKLDLFAVIGAVVFILGWIAYVNLFSSDGDEDYVTQINEDSKKIESRIKEQKIPEFEAPTFENRIAESLQPFPAPDFGPWNMERNPAVAFLYEPPQRQVPVHEVSHLTSLKPDRDSKRRRAIHLLHGKFGKFEHVVVDEAVLEARKGGGKWETIRKLENPASAAEFTIRLEDVEVDASYEYQVRTTAHSTSTIALAEDAKSRTSKSIGPMQVPPDDTWVVVTIHSQEFENNGDARPRKATVSRTLWDYEKGKQFSRQELVVDATGTEAGKTDPDIWLKGKPILGTEYLIFRIRDDRVVLCKPGALAEKKEIAKGDKPANLMPEEIKNPLPAAEDDPAAGLSPVSVPKKENGNATDGEFKD